MHWPAVRLTSWLGTGAAVAVVARRAPKTIRDLKMGAIVEVVVVRSSSIQKNDFFEFLLLEVLERETDCTAVVY